jgi:hypothetical protein
MTLDQMKEMLSIQLMKATSYKIVNQKLNSGLPLAVHFKLPFTVMVPLRFAVAHFRGLYHWNLQHISSRQNKFIVGSQQDMKMHFATHNRINHTMNFPSFQIPDETVPSDCKRTPTP